MIPELVLLVLAQAAAEPAPKPAAPEAPIALSLTEVKRVYVDQLGASPAAVQIRDAMISSLALLRNFTLTENIDRADAILRGSAEDLIYNEDHEWNDNLNASIHGAGSSSVDAGVRSSQSNSHALGIGESEHSRSNERKHEATAAVRLVNKEGDVLWSTTQESSGGKFRGAMTDLADRVARSLAEEFKRERVARR